MKKISLFMAVLFCLLAFAACGEGETQESTASDFVSSEASVEASSVPEVSSLPEESSEPDEDKILTAEEMSELEEINSVAKNEQFCTSSAVVYNIEFVSDGVKMNAQLALPINYEKNDYPTVIYLPDISYDESFLVQNFANKKLNVIRMFSRGAKGNEGMKDVCGKDFVDTELLLEICKSTDFLSRGGIFVAGSSEGSIHALKLAAEHSEDLLGCAVINVISDIESVCEIKENSKKFFEYFLGGSFEEVPEEYKSRSAVYYADKIKVPVLIFAYKDSEQTPRQQAEVLKESIDNAGGQSEIYDIDVVYSDFNGTAFLKLVPWVKSLSRERDK